MKYKNQFECLVNEQKAYFMQYNGALTAYYKGLQETDWQTLYTPQGLAMKIQAQRDALADAYRKRSAELSAQAQVAAKAAISQLHPHTDRSEDFSIRVQNALTFLQMEDAESLNDEVAHAILKDFEQDCEQMWLFSRVVEKISGKPADEFPKTFSAYQRQFAAQNAADELKYLSEQVFTAPLMEDGTQFRFGNVLYSTPVQPYTTLAGFSRMMQAAETVDAALSE